ncbi:hypothetical protein LJ655_24175 [Paraburkholderia sp. MMS20-SJTN17]|uniref:Uncharacterized protein n=1 Tax=Paraburkholderia translucens TaxID=2886945 RepID=A0ABS8KKH7_9BURK|nr:hypothetical protein [Paraburkholderia sp. MMS20-SJTN17]
MESQNLKITRTSMASEENCLLCRVTYSIFSTYSPMPHAMALNVETGEFFPFDQLRSYSTGREMVEALGTAWACQCSRGWFHQQFVLRDSQGKVLSDTHYTVRFSDNRLARGTTDTEGRTRRFRTNDARQIVIYLGHKDA